MFDPTFQSFEVVDQGTRLVYRLSPQARERIAGEWKRWKWPFASLCAGLLFALLWFGDANINPSLDEHKHLIFGTLVLICLLVVFLTGIIEVQRIWGRDELELTPTKIRITHRLGPFYRSRAKFVSEIDQITVVRRIWESHIFYTLYLDDSRGHSTSVVSHYPQSMLLHLAGELSFRVKAFVPEDDGSLIGRGKPPVRLDTEIPAEVIERPEKPKGVRSSIEHKGDGIILRLSAFTSSNNRGDGRIENKLLSLVGGSLVLGVVLGMFGVLPFYIAYRGLSDAWKELIGGVKMENGNPYAGLVFGALFALIGSAFWLQILLGYLRRTSLIVTPSLFVVENRWLNRIKRREWSREQIVDLRAIVELSNSPDGPAYFESLRLFPKYSERDSAPIDLDVGNRSKPELEWIASMCREVLGLHQQTGEQKGTSE